MVMTAPQNLYWRAQGVVRQRRQIDRAAPANGDDSPPPKLRADRTLPCAASRAASVHADAPARSRPPPKYVSAARRRIDGSPSARQCRRQRIPPPSSPRRYGSGPGRRAPERGLYDLSCIYTISHIRRRQLTCAKAAPLSIASSGDVKKSQRRRRRLRQNGGGQRAAINRARIDICPENPALRPVETRRMAVEHMLAEVIVDVEKAFANP